MEKTNELSRRLYWKIKNYNENQKLIKEKWIRSLIEIVVEGLRVELIEENEKSKDKEVVRVIKEMKKVGKMSSRLRVS